MREPRQMAREADRPRCVCARRADAGDRGFRGDGHGALARRGPRAPPRLA